MKKNRLLFLLLFTTPFLFKNTNATAQITRDTTTYWWNDAVFYEAFVRSYSDTDGDGIGDFKGLTNKLDYLNDGNPATHNDLGITALWLMPINASPSYHGYDISDYRQLQAQYGTNQDFTNLVSEAHKRGIRVIVDFVMNHSSDQHPWFKAAAAGDPKYRNFYRWATNQPNNHWYYNAPSNYYYAIFGGSLPDLNYNNAAVKDTMFNVAKFWLNDMKADGFRCDAAKFIFENGDSTENTYQTFNFWRDFHNFYKGIKPSAMAVGEVWDKTTTVQKYVNGKFDFCFEFDLATAILRATDNQDPIFVKNIVLQDYNNYSFQQFGTFLTNHDQNRVMDYFLNDLGKAKMAAAMYLTFPGVPFIYYGEEVGMNGVVDPSPNYDKGRRRPMQWDATPNAGFTTGTPWYGINSNSTTYNVSNELKDSTSLLRWYQKLIALRNQESSIRKGIFKNVDNSGTGIYSYVRMLHNDAVLVVLNLNSSLATNVSIDLSKNGIATGINTYLDLMNGNATKQMLLSPSGATPGLDLPGQSMLVYKFKTDGTLGIHETENVFAKTTIFPNPANDNIVISFANAPLSPVTITVTDVVGHLVHAPERSVMNPTQYGVDISQFAAGIYYLSLKSNGQMVHMKMVKQ
jgi:alpha-amylase